MESVDRAAAGDGHVAAFAHGVGQRDQVVVVGVGGQRAGVPDQLPAARRGDPAGMADAEVPGVRLRAMASGPTTAVESEYTKVSVATA